MLQMEKCESFQERMEPLLNTLPTKHQYLKRYIQQFYKYQSLISSNHRLFLAYLIVHLLLAIAFHLHLISTIFKANISTYLLIVPELLWLVSVVFFKKVFLVDDPHLMGKKRFNLIIKIKPTQLYSIILLIILIFLIIRNIFLSRNYFLMTADIVINLLALRIILQIYNKEVEVFRILEYMKGQDFYSVPVVVTHSMEEPFQIKYNSTSEKHIGSKEKIFTSPFQKYYKPSRCKENEMYDSDEFQCQLYSH